MIIRSIFKEFIGVTPKRLARTYRAFTGLTPTRHVEIRRRFLREHPRHVLDSWPLPAD